MARRGHGAVVAREVQWKSLAVYHAQIVLDTGVLRLHRQERWKTTTSIKDWGYYPCEGETG